MRSCLKACCASAARKISSATLPERTRSHCHVIASALLGLVLTNSVGCGDSREPPDRVGSMRVEPALDAGAAADASSSCLDDTCQETKLDDRAQCPDSAQSDRGETIHYSVRVIDLVNGMPRQDVKAKACRNSDSSCEDPVATFVDTEQTGQVQLELPNGFVGFFELTSDAVDTLLYVTKPLVRNTIDRDITVPTSDTISLLASLLDYQWDMDKGVVELEVLDCSGAPQAGIHFDCREGGDAFYMVDGVPFKSEHMTMYDATNNTAEGGFLNVPPGVAQFSAQVGADPDAMALGTLQVQIRPHTLTIIDLHP